MKQVISKNNPQKVVFIDQLDPNKIYIFKSIFDDESDYYKAHKIGNDRYAFIDMGGSKCYATGSHYSTLESLVSEVVNRSSEYKLVFEFDTVKEFAEWLVNDVS